MARLETCLGAHLEDRRAHDAARNGHLGRGEPRGVERHEARVGAAREVAQDSGGNRREVGVLVREDVAGGGEARRQARVALLRDGQDLVAHERAQVAGIGVGRVLAPDDAAHAQQLAELVVGPVEQRAHDPVAPARDRREPGGPRPADRVHKEGLGAVVGGVRGQDPRRRSGAADLGAQLVGQLNGGGVTGEAARVLDVAVARGRELGHVNAAHVARDPETRGQLTDSFLILIGVQAPELVIHMEDVQALARDARLAPPVVDVERRGRGEHEQRRRVRAARHHEHHRRRELGVRLAARPLESLQWRCVSARDARHCCLPRRVLCPLAV